MARSKYDYWLTNEGLTLIKGWAMNGMTIEDISKNCGVSRKTFWEWQNKYPDISNAIKINREIAIYMMENALFTNGVVNMNLGAQAYWLNNMTKGKWSNNPERNADGGEGVTIVDDL